MNINETRRDGLNGFKHIIVTRNMHNNIPTISVTCAHIQHGISRRTFKDFVHTLEDAGLTVYDEDKDVLVYVGE